MIKAKVVCDSVAAHGGRLTTLELEFHRYILAEFNTHRSFSRSASSSRAIPIQTLIDRVVNDPAMPVFWGKNQKGMQAREELDVVYRVNAYRVWLEARDAAVVKAKELAALGVHKQLVNRLLEPWSHIQVVVTATEWENFFNLRTHPDAQPEMQSLARAMRDAIDGSIPQRLEDGKWHLPYILPEEYAQIDWSSIAAVRPFIKWSVARCARVSYNRHGTDQIDHASDERLCDFLTSSGHMSPLEHQAHPLAYANECCGNFNGFRQYRKTLSGEAIYQP
jgi:thymidylate synthase ThyX